ncbi:hypothetical protein ES703_46946 [subsurface metagenome]
MTPEELNTLVVKLHKKTIQLQEYNGDSSSGCDCVY